MHRRSSLALLVPLTVLGSCAIEILATGPAGTPELVHGIAIGDVTPTAAVLWAGANGPGTAVFELDADPAFPAPRVLRAILEPQADFTAQVDVTGLEPATRYQVRVQIENAAGASVGASVPGSFSTAPDPADSMPVRFVVGGDVGGQGFCRRPTGEYPIFRAMAARQPDLFLANGDMIYADGDCPADRGGGWKNLPGTFKSVADPRIDWTDRDAVREAFLAHWRYNRSDPAQRAFLAHVPYYAQWDDHEVINDFGAAWPSWSPQPERAGFPNLAAAGRAALLAYSPIRRPAQDPERLYRSFRHGQELEIFLIDGRSYRSRNDLVDRPEHAKTLLGDAQRAWLKNAVISSQATWKVISSNVPLSVPTGSKADLYGRDGWANGDRFEPGFAQRTGFERELLSLLRDFDAADVENLVVVVTDVHFAMVLRYAPDLDGDGDTLEFHEVLSGPLNAVTLVTPPQLDPTLRPVVLYAEGGIFNFAELWIAPENGRGSRLHAVIRGENGEVRPGSRLQIRSRVGPRPTR